MTRPRDPRRDPMQHIVQQAQARLGTADGHEQPPHSTRWDRLTADDQSLIIGALRQAAAGSAEDAVRATRAAAGQAPSYGPAASVRMADAQQYLDHAEQCSRLADGLAVAPDRQVG